MTKKIRMLLVAFFVVMVGVFAYPLKADALTSLLFKFNGTGSLLDGADLDTLLPPGLRGLVPGGALCYAIDLVNPRTDRVIGVGVDCFTDIVPNGNDVDLTDTAFFLFRRGTGFALQGPVAVRDASALGNPNISHITGTFPQVSNVIGGVGGRFRNAPGNWKVRLSGGVEMSNFPDSITFDCIFVVDRD